MMSALFLSSSPLCPLLNSTAIAVVLTVAIAHHSGDVIQVTPCAANDGEGRAAPERRCPVF